MVAVPVESVNDRYGHQAGDEVLQIVARILMTHAEAVGATAARYGGEEFAVLMPGGSCEDAMALAEQVRLALLIHASDAALIHAKNTGRDRVVAAGDHAMPTAEPAPAAPPPRRRRRTRRSGSR